MSIHHVARVYPVEAGYGDVCGSGQVVWTFQMHDQFRYWKAFPLGSGMMPASLCHRSFEIYTTLDKVDTPKPRHRTAYPGYLDFFTFPATHSFWTCVISKKSSPL